MLTNYACYNGSQILTLRVYHAQHCTHRINSASLTTTVLEVWTQSEETSCLWQEVNGGVQFPSHICLTVKPVLWTTADKTLWREAPVRSQSSGWAHVQSKTKKTEPRPQEKGWWKHVPGSALSTVHELTHVIVMTPHEVSMKNIHEYK